MSAIHQHVRTTRHDVLSAAPFLGGLVAASVVWSPLHAIVGAGFVYVGTYMMQVVVAFSTLLMAFLPVRSWTPWILAAYGWVARATRSSMYSGLLLAWRLVGELWRRSQARLSPPALPAEDAR